MPAPSTPVDAAPKRRSVRIGAAGVLAGLAAAAVSLASDDPDVRAPGFVVLTVALGWSFVGTGLYASVRRPDSHIGALMVAAGFSWFLGTLDALDVPILFATGWLTSYLWAGVLGHIVVTFPRGRTRSRGERIMVAAGYFIVIPFQAVPGLWGSFDELRCTSCQADALLIEHHELATTLDTVQTALGVVIVGLVCRIVARRWRAASQPERRALAPVIAVGALSLALLAGHAVLWTTGLDAGATALALTGLAATALVPFAFLSGLLRARLRRAHVLSVLHRELRELPGSGHVRHALADAFADPSLVLACWAPDQSAFVDAAGLPVTLPDTGGRATVIVKSQALPVAAIIYDEARVDDEELVWTAGAAAALWLENERLQAELRATIVALRASRGRLVQAGDAERRRIERDLHDGAQQRLVSLLLAVKLESRRLGAEVGPAAALIGSVERGLAESLEELQALAAGIMPPVLTDSGLAPAVRELADRTPVDVELAQLPAERLPLDVEIAAYFVVSEALTNVVKHAHANRAAVRIVPEPARLVVEVSDDGIGGAHRDRGTGLRGLADRLSALDGRLHVESAPGLGTRLRGEIALPVKPASSRYR